MSSIPERFIWAASFVGARDDDQILEIGCGTGVLLEQMLLNGKYLHLHAVEKSEAMLAKAKKRNLHAFEKGVLTLEKAIFPNIKSKEFKYDKIIAFNVNFFVREAVDELKLIKELLKPNGSLFVFYQAPYDIDLQFLKEIGNRLKDIDFVIKEMEIKTFKPNCGVVVANL